MMAIPPSKLHKRLDSHLQVMVVVVYINALSVHSVLPKLVNKIHVRNTTSPCQLVPPTLLRKPNHDIARGTSVRKSSHKVQVRMEVVRFKPPRQRRQKPCGFILERGVDAHLLGFRGEKRQPMCFNCCTVFPKEQRTKDTAM